MANRGSLVAADHEHWHQWLTKGLSMMGLSMAYMSRKLQFRVGDYTAMIKDPRMAGIFDQVFCCDESR